MWENNSHFPQICEIASLSDIMLISTLIYALLWLRDLLIRQPQNTPQQNLVRKIFYHSVFRKSTFGPSCGREQYEFEK